MTQQLSGQVVLNSVQEDEPTTEVVATFSDVNTSDPASSFAATVNWGDGTTETGTVTGTNGSFSVSVPDSTHVYADEGTDPIAVTITGTAGGNIAPTDLRYFLAIDGLNGGSTDAAHVGWFDVSSYDVGALVAAITKSKTFSPLAVTLPSTGLTDVLADLAQGTPITSVRLEGVTNSGQAVYDLTLGNVSVSNYADASGGDKLSFSYQQVSLTTTAINPDGSLGSSQSFSSAGAIPAPTPNTAGGNNIAPANPHYFLAIDGLDGGSRDAAHVGWFDVSSYDVGALVAAMTGSATFSPLNVTFGSTGLTDVLADLANGTPIKSVRLEGVTNTGQSVYDLTLGNASVNSYADVATGAQLSFSYQQVALTTTTSNSVGSPGNSQTFSWDLTQGKPGASIPAPTPSTTAGNTAPNSNLDYFLAVDGIDGQSLNRTHQNWFEISNYDFSALMSTTGSPTFSPLTVTLDASGLTGLLADLPTSTLIKSVRLEGVTRGTNPQAVYDLTLGNVRVSDYEDASSGDKLSFTYQQVDLTTTAINQDGSRGGSQTFSWDRLNNVPGTHPVSAPVPGTTPGELAGPDAKYFLAIDGINGGATDVNHVGWFDVSSYDFGAQITALAMGTKPAFSPLTVTLPSTGSTGVLAGLLEDSTLPPPTPDTPLPIKWMELEGVAADGQAVYDLALGNVTVTSYDDASGGDKLSFSYQQIGLTTFPRNLDNSLGTPLRFGWDVTRDQTISPTSIPVPSKPINPGGGAGNVAPANLRYFLVIDGLDGGSVDAAHPGWFDVSSYDFAAQLLATGSLPRFSPLSVTLPSTGLTGVLADLAPGTDITSVRLEGVNTAGQAVYDLTLGNATVTNYADAPGGNQLDFNYQQVALTTRAINANGSLGTSQTSAWDVASNSALAGSIPAPTPGNAAGNIAPINLHYFLAINGLDGGSTDAAHAGWFDVSSYEFDVKNPTLAGRATFSPLSVTLPSTGATRVFADLAQLSTVTSVRLEGVTDTGEAAYDLTLGNVAVTNYSDAASGAQLSFSYQQVALTTTAINPNGSPGSSQNFAWDVVHATPGGPILAPVPNTASGQIAPTGTVTVTEGDVLNATPISINPIPGIALANVPVATVTDSNINNTVGDFTATINWGDGTTTAGTLTGGSGTFTVAGGHTYAVSGIDTVTVTVTDDSPGTATATATQTVNVTQPLAGNLTLPPSLPEDVSLSGAVALFSDTNLSDIASDFTATINWGDGTTTAGAVTGSNGSFAVSEGFGHTYADEASVQPVVTVTRTTDNDQIALTASLTVTENDNLTAMAVPIIANPGVALTNVPVARITDFDLGNTASDFTATINWGDGTTTAGTLTGGSGTFTVAGDHTYASSGIDTVTVTVADDSPGTATATATQTVNVRPPLVGNLTLPPSLPEDVSLSGAVALFSDTNLSDIASDFTATINWGDGTTTAGAVTGSNGSFAVSEVSGHTYADEAAVQPVVTITRTTDNDQIALTVSLTVTENDNLTATPVPISAVPGVALTNVPVAKITDFDLGNTASDFTATINWGDGTTTAGTLTGGSGTFTIAGDHTYAVSGIDTITVTVADDAPGTATATATQTVNVTQPLSGNLLLPPSLQEDVALPGAVAIFSDTSLSDTAGDFTATIDWGDGTTDAGAVTGANGSFVISDGVGHTYADEVNAQPVVTITRTTDNDQIVLTGNLAVTEGDVLTPHGMSITAQAGQAFNGTVATFTDSNVNNVASDFVATIDWGDGTTTAGAVTDVAGAVGVSGTHIYTATGTDNVVVTLTDDAPGTATATATTTADITPCYCDGTLILTDRGEVPVETLTIGDRVITADGAERPIRWIGRRSYAGRFVRGAHVLPICFKAGALDVNSPRRDLWVSPHHAMFLDGVLIEALDLVNGVSIFQAERVERVDYFHIELDTHDIIVAEGALSESFVDDDSRGMFQNAHEFAGFIRTEQRSRRAIARGASRLAWTSKRSGDKSRVAPGYPMCGRPRRAGRAPSSSIASFRKLVTMGAPTPFWITCAPCRRRDLK